MVAGCGNKCVKYTFWAINFLFFILGALIVGLSLWLRFDTSFLTKVTNAIKVDTGSLPLDGFYLLLYIVIGFGSVLLILGFLGCCGSACEVICVIGLYFFFVLVLFIAEIVGIVLYFVNKNSIRDNFVNIWRNEMVMKYQTSQPIRNTLDNVQAQVTSISCHRHIARGNQLETENRLQLQCQQSLNSSLCGCHAVMSPEYGKGVARRLSAQRNAVSHANIRHLDLYILGGSQWSF
ncbi:unnamed protein product [Heligmosomoides polygyrus]|uniref:Tetraspanin n=1 Tax=Heligmosomoides polygyrus TaxID=6339 RepID=A0A183GLS2_HELPZ|nr:unnamed protein product [Heligmosomoides polygyrus]